MDISRITGFFNKLKKPIEKQASSFPEASKTNTAKSDSSRPCPDKGPWLAQEWAPGVVVLHSEDPNYQVVMQLSGEFRSHAHQLAYAQSLAAWMNHHLPEPEPLELSPAETPPAMASSSTGHSEESNEEATTPDTAPKRTKLMGSKLTRLQKKNMQKKDVQPKVEPLEPKLNPPQVEQQSSSTAQATYSVPPSVPVVAEPEVSAPPPKKVSADDNIPHGCHCDLADGMYPDACVIDVGQREACAHAAEGIEKKDCFFWRPITMHSLQRHASN